MTSSTAASPFPVQHRRWLLLGATLLVGACAGEQPVRNTVQHGAIAKEDLLGPDGKAVWYYLRTVTDVPYATGFTMVGEQSLLEKIRWDIQEKRLYARRAYDFVRGGDTGATSVEQGSDPDHVLGAPVAAFAVEKHFDIIRDYNTSTGEEINKLVENEDRHWYERRFMRVDWSKNLIADHVFLVQYGETGVDPLKQEPVPYYVSDPADPDTMRIDRPPKTEDNPDPTANYLEVTSKLMVTPEEVTISFIDGDYRMPACYMAEDYGPEFSSIDCSAQEIKLRHSFMLAGVAGKRDYDSLIYDDRWMERFGYFSSERRAYHPVYGQRETERVRLANRWNIWNKVLSDETCAVQLPAQSGDQQAIDAARKSADKACVDKVGEGSRCAEMEQRCTLPPQQREGVRKIVYYLNVGFPEELVPAAKDALVSWNDAFQTTAARLLYPNDDQRDTQLLAQRKQEIGTIFEVRENSCSDAAVKAFIQRFPELEDRLPASAADPLVGKELLRACSALERATAYRKADERFTWQRIGDLRYSMLYWVGAPTRMGLLGYGPAQADPETGEIVQANAFLYGPPQDTYTARAADIVGLLNCDSEACVEQHVPGVPIKDWFVLAQQLAPKNRKALSSADVSRIANAMQTDWLQGLKLPKHDFSTLDNLRKSIRKRRAAMAESTALGLHGGTTANRLAPLKGTALERLAQSNYLSSIGVPADSPLPSVSGSPGGASLYSWAGPGMARARRKARMKLAARGVELAAFFDDAILGLALRYKEKNNSWQQVFDDLRARITTAIAQHELGHTLGLRHNFAGSYDALNYHDSYWKLRQLDDLGRALPRYKAPLNNVELYGVAGDPQANEGIGSYMYSTVMDYAGRFNGDIAGIGYYDRAAIKFGYGQLVEVFDQIAPSVPDRYLLANAQVSIRWGEPMLWTITCDGELYRGLHYTEYPRLVGGKQNLGRRNRVDVPLSRMTTKKLSAIAPGCNVYQWGALWNSDVPVDEKGRFEVPFRFCSDEYESSSPECSAYDLGADMYEQTEYLIDSYQAYYLFHNVKLDRTGFSLWAYQDFILWRYFEPLRSSMQFYMLTRGDFSGDYRGASYLGDQEIKDFFEADDGYGPWTVAVDRSLSFLLRVIATPEIGQYWLNDAGTRYEQWARYDASDNELPPDLVLSAPTGKYHVSTWDFDSGYFWYDKMTHIGVFHDKYLALWTLTDPETWFLGRDTSNDLRQYSINYFRLYPDLLMGYFRGMLTDDWTPTAAYGQNEQLLDRDYTLDDPPPAGAKPVDPGIGYSLQLYAGLLGTALIPWTYDTSFIDRARIWVTGATDAITPTTPPVCFTDELGLKEYCAVSFPDGGGHETGVGAAMIAHANQLSLAYQADPSPQNKLALQQYVDILDLQRSIVSTFAYTPFE